MLKPVALRARTITTRNLQKFSRVMMSSENQLLVSQKNNCMIIELNRPKALNALSVDMCLQMNDLLQNKINCSNSTVGAIIMKGAGGKAFCAGGDVKEIWQELHDKGVPPQETLGSRGALHADFFRDEYTMNYLLGTSPRPQVSLWDGIIMGGGVGISALGRFRVTSEKSMFAMPETAIGLFPDVGSGSWLPYLKDGYGNYIGMTGVRLGAADLLHTGIATHYVTSDKLAELEAALIAEVKTTDPKEAIEKVKGVLDSFDCGSPDDSKATILKHGELISQCFGDDAVSVEEIVARLKEHSAENEWAKKTLATMLRMSPRSLKVTHRQLLQAKGKDLGDVLRMEFGIVLRCMQASDFQEGIRALLVDKDNKPVWTPQSLEEVTPEHVDQYFSPLLQNELLL